MCITIINFHFFFLINTFWSYIVILVVNLTVSFVGTIIIPVLLGVLALK